MTGAKHRSYRIPPELSRWDCGHKDVKKPRTIKLAYGERIVAVVPERCNGPGWSNSPAWVYIATNDGRLREECIQPDERTLELHALFAAGCAMCNALSAAVPSVKSKRPNVRGEPTKEATR